DYHVYKLKYFLKLTLRYLNFNDGTKSSFGIKIISFIYKGGNKGR
ncbi:hypothetical protein QE152_g33733, partial [Popillia japonica]